MKTSSGAGSLFSCVPVADVEGLTGIGQDLLDRGDGVRPRQQEGGEEPVR